MTMRIFHRYLVYVTKDVGRRVRYPGSVRLCNNEGRVLRLRLRYGGPFTKTGLENYVTYVALVSNDIIVSNKSIESEAFQLSPGECINFDVEYEVSGELADELDFVKLKMINDGLLSVGGFQFDVITED
ncbi:conserved hypothetical protein [Vulcanisaeta distributa DSM 14429]|uniref:Uncharacterized protein n=2 Tax=Vulcanisaeta distributa TaxID=164451 RepID=E1QRC5_VULDI|nr:conserved hypothetical protein [Vulcanisaeta distributa DSM 14429]